MTELVNSPVNGDNADGVQGADKSAAIVATWRNVFKVHPACAIFPAMSPDELRALGEDIKANGLREDIKYVRYNRRTEQYDGMVRPGDDDDVDLILIDGGNRLNAMEMVGVPVPTTLDEFDNFTEKENLWFRNDEEIVRYIISANIRRRHLSGKDLDRIIGELLKLDPYKSDRQIGRETNVDHKKVGAVRHQLEDVGKIPHVKKRLDSRGRKQPVRKKSSPPEKSPQAAVEGHDPPRDATQPELPHNLAPEPAESAVEIVSREPMLSDRDVQAPVEQAQDNDPAKAQQPPDPARDHLAYILGGARALSRVPLDADFDRMATIIDHDVRERCKEDMKMVAKLARLLLIALERSDLERDPAAA